MFTPHFLVFWRCVCWKEILLLVSFSVIIKIFQNVEKNFFLAKLWKKCFYYCFLGYWRKTLVIVRHSWMKTNTQWESFFWSVYSYDIKNIVASYILHRIAFTYILYSVTITYGEVNYDFSSDRVHVILPNWYRLCV